MSNYLLTVIGATAIGKTALSIALAQHFNTEIISCDSRQFYKEMRIGTAVPSAEELTAAPHHFIQNISIFDYYSVGQFEKDSLKKLDELFLKRTLLSWLAEAVCIPMPSLKVLTISPKLTLKSEKN